MKIYVAYAYEYHICYIYKIYYIRFFYHCKMTLTCLVTQKRVSRTRRSSISQISITTVKPVRASPRFKEIEGSLTPTAKCKEFSQDQESTLI